MRGKYNKLGEGEGTKLGEPCPKVRFSQDRLPIESFFFLSLSGLLRANVVCANVASRKYHSTHLIWFAGCNGANASVTVTCVFEKKLYHSI